VSGEWCVVSGALRRCATAVEEIEQKIAKGHGEDGAAGWTWLVLLEAESLCLRLILPSGSSEQRPNGSGALGTRRTMSLGKRQKRVCRTGYACGETGCGACSLFWKASWARDKMRQNGAFFGVFEHVSISEHGRFSLVVRCVASRRPWRR
jgi:hypothetical protein